LANDRTENGFTLIEALVALAIFGLAAVTLLRLEGATLSGTRLLERKVIAQIVARNLAAEALTDPVSVPFGTTTGVENDADTAWRWTRVTTRMPDSRLQQIAISVADPGGGEAGSLVIYRRVG
jgi:general secretion pathway protein I